MFSLDFVAQHHVSTHARISTLANDLLFTALGGGVNKIGIYSVSSKNVQFMKFHPLIFPTGSSIEDIKSSPDGTRLFVLVEGPHDHAILISETKEPFRVVNRISPLGPNHITVNNRYLFYKCKDSTLVHAFTHDGASAGTIELESNQFVYHFSATRDKLWFTTDKHMESVDISFQTKQNWKRAVRKFCWRPTPIGEILLIQDSGIGSDMQTHLVHPSQPEKILFTHDKNFILMQQNDWQFHRGLLVFHDTQFAKLEFYKPRFLSAVALLGGLHIRVGKPSLLSALRRKYSIFDVQALRVCLRLAGVLFALRSSK